MLRLIPLVGGILFATLAASQPAASADASSGAVVNVNVRRELRKCNARRKKFRRLVTRKGLDYQFLLITKDEDGSWEASTVVRGGVIQGNEEDGMEKGTSGTRTVEQIMNDICKALRAANASPNSSHFFDQYKVRWKRVAAKPRILIPTVVKISYAQDDNGDVGLSALTLSKDVGIINYRIKDFAMGDGGGMPCPVDVKECDDGSILSPDPLSCDFAECPKENIFCTQDVKECDEGPSWVVIRRTTAASIPVRVILRGKRYLIRRKSGWQISMAPLTTSLLMNECASVPKTLYARGG
jgi:hypothetical protein